ITARHSFATVLKRNHTNLELIRELMVHSDLKTTRNYLDSFENETLRAATDILVPKRELIHDPC
ncbi:MAG: tyrosine-type recombinase/integrase, partial [Flavisolibacter sp.]|nr:tyrosine-type recombinase/integrase [Flavisolibacter sp.]